MGFGLGLGVGFLELRGQGSGPKPKKSETSKPHNPEPYLSTLSKISFVARNSHCHTYAGVEALGFGAIARSKRTQTRTTVLERTFQLQFRIDSIHVPGAPNMEPFRVPKMKPSGFQNGPVPSPKACCFHTLSEYLAPPPFNAFEMPVRRVSLGY